MTALETQGKCPFLLHEDSRKGAGTLFLKSLKNIFGLRMLNEAVYFAEATSNADFLFDKDSFHTLDPRR
jgi:hypothetical protein